MYKYVSKTKYRFGICISIGVRQLKFISLRLFECSFPVSFFLDSRIQEAWLQSRGVPRKRKDTYFDPKLIGGSTNFWEDGGGCCCRLSRLICSPSLFRSGKRDLVDSKKMGLSGNFSDEEGGGRTRHPPSKTANETCDECLCGKFSPPRSTNIIYLSEWQISTCSQWVDAAWYTGSTSK